MSCIAPQPVAYILRKLRAYARSNVIYFPLFIRSYTTVIIRIWIRSIQMLILLLVGDVTFSAQHNPKKLKLEPHKKLGFTTYLVNQAQSSTIDGQRTKIHCRIWSPQDSHVQRDRKLQNTNIPISQRFSSDPLTIKWKMNSLTCVGPSRMGFKSIP